MRVLVSLVILFLLGCSEAQTPDIPEIRKEGFVPARPIGEIVSDTFVNTLSGAWDAVQMPLEDVGIKRQPIPEKLQQIVVNPYSLPQPMSCDNIRKEIAELDLLIGVDVCTPENQMGTASYKGQYVEQGAKAAREQAVGIVSSHINVMPFRGIVRRISGADSHIKKVDNAYQAGRLRRAFLKGLLGAMDKKCMDYCSIPKKAPAEIKVE